jgi:hypothetical protein
MPTNRINHIIHAAEADAALFVLERGPQAVENISIGNVVMLLFLKA